MRVLFDVAINHCSEQHHWFVDAIHLKEKSKYKDFFIWTKTPQTRFSQVRIIFQGICESNWEALPTSLKEGEEGEEKEYYFHRFFPSQPDLNYANPKVLVEMTKVLVEWKEKGVDGFRADAAACLWKEEGTSCENLPQTHLILRFFRCALDYLQEGTVLLAEACQPPSQIIHYFGQDDECNAA